VQQQVASREAQEVNLLRILITHERVSDLMRHAFVLISLCVLVSLPLVPSTSAILVPDDEAYLLLVDEGLLIYQANDRYLHRLLEQTFLNTSNESQAFERAERIGYESVIAHPGGGFTLFRGALVIPSEAEHAYIRRGAQETRSRGPVERDGWEPIEPGTLIEAYEITPYGTITDLAIFYLWNGTFPEGFENSYASLHIAGVSGAIRIDDRIFTHVPHVDPESILSGDRVPTFGYYDSRVQRVGRYPGANIIPEAASSRWPLIKPSERLRALLWMILIITLLVVPPLTARFVPHNRFWISRTLIPVSGIAAVFLLVRFIITGIPGELYGVPPLTALFVVILSASASGIITIGILAQRNKNR
jgi:hypothetical protein